ncbi:MAG: hypothetical protein QOJ16_3945, partial [Acidobacteriota bacterium]|nr:hypothetical protein [Acidobacteriota bacterium]
PIQRWFFEQEFTDPHWFNQSALLRPRRPLDPRLLARTADRLFTHHDALRLRFVQEGEGWSQSCAAPGEPGPFAVLDLRALPVGMHPAAIEAAAEALQGSLDLERGPVVRLAWFDLGTGRAGRLFVVFHHLVVDEVSWRVLLDDLGTVYSRFERGDAADLPAKTTSVKAWAERLLGEAGAGGLAAELPYWLAPGRSAVRPLPLDAPSGRDTMALARTLVTELPVEDTAHLLRDVLPVYRLQAQEVLLAALALALAGWTGDRLALIDLEGHGREEVFAGVDLTRTVGWFAILYPLLLDLQTVRAPGEVLRAVKEQVRSLPHKGLGYGVLRYLGESGEAARLRALPRAEILFNYLGQSDALGGGDTAAFAAAPEPSGFAVSPRARRSHLIEIAAMAAGGRLRVEWTYGPEVLQPATVEALAARFVAALGDLIAHCLSPEAGGYTPSDFPLSGLTQEELDRVVGRDREVEDVYPLSPVQQGMLFHTVFEPEVGMYVGQFGYEIRGELEVDRLRQAWQGVIDRHPALRTGIVWREVRRPVQIVRRRVELSWEESDWRDLDSPAQAVDLAALRRQDRERGFDLERAPLSRFRLIRRGESLYHLVWTFHQTLLDGWSLPVILTEVGERYRAAAAGRELAVPPAPSFGAYIAWLEGQGLGAAEAFWRRELAGFTTPTPLAIEGPRRSAPLLDFYGEKEVEYPADLSVGLQALARSRQLTLNTVLQGAWCLLLSRYSGEPDVVFGVTVSGRPPVLAGIEETVGMFLNTLPLRVAAPGAERWVPWLRKLQERQVESRQYEHASLADIQRWSELPAGSHLFESYVVFQNYPMEEALAESGGSLSVGDAGVEERGNYPLGMIAEPSTRLAVRIEYDGSRFAASAIERLHGHLRSLLAGLVSSPEARLEDLGLLAEWEREQVLRQWQGEDVGWATGTLGGRLGSRAVAQPDAIAAVAGVRHLSYGELSSRGALLAGYLEALGTGPETVVGLCVERSLELVVGTWGALLSGASYVPLDPDYPGERLA